MAIDPTAIVSSKAQIDPTVEIGPYAIIEDDVTIGPECRIGPHAVIRQYTRMGRGNAVHPGAVLGDLPQDRSFKPCRSYVEIGEGNVFREHCTVHRGTGPETVTRIGNDCLLMASAHVAHNCRIGDSVNIANGALVAGHVEVGDRAFISGCVLCHQFVRIGRLVMAGGGARVITDVPPFMMVLHETDVISINLVGLRRAGVGADQIAEVRGAYRLLYRSGLPFRKALEKLAAGPVGPLVREIIDFAAAPSKRGMAGPPHGAVRAGKADQVQAGE